MWCVTTVLTIKKAIVSESQKTVHVQINIDKKLNLRTKVGICVSTYSNADVVCCSTTWRAELNDLRLNVDGSSHAVFSTLGSSYLNVALTTVHHLFNAYQPPVISRKK